MLSLWFLQIVVYSRASNSVSNKYFDSQDICKDINALSPLVKDALKAGDQLLPHCDEDDKDLVKMKMDKLKNKYQDLLRNSDEKRAKIKEAKQLSEKCFNGKDDLMNWFDDMNQKLAAAKEEDLEAQEEQARLKVKHKYFKYDNTVVESDC